MQTVDDARDFRIDDPQPGNRTGRLGFPSGHIREDSQAKRTRCSRPCQGKVQERGRRGQPQNEGDRGRSRQRFRALLGRAELEREAVECVTQITETRQYLTFKLGNEVFATDVAKVREVLDFTTVTEIPRTPEFMSGVINLRGSVVPVVDLRLCLPNVENREDQNTCIVVVEVLLDE